MGARRNMIIFKVKTYCRYRPQISNSIYQDGKHLTSVDNFIT